MTYIAERMGAILRAKASREAELIARWRSRKRQDEAGNLSSGAALANANAMAAIRTELETLEQKALDEILAEPEVRQSLARIVDVAKEVLSRAGTMADVAVAVGSLASVVNALAQVGETISTLSGR